MPTNAEAFMKKPWTIFTSIFIHQNVIFLVLNVIGIVFFGNLTSLLFSQKVVFPLFISGGMIASASIWIFKLLPLTEHMLDNTLVGGSSGAVMTLAILSTFYMPEQIMRLYGVYPLKLKFIGRAMLLSSVVAIFLKYEYTINFLHLGGALGGYIFLVILKRNKFHSLSKVPFLSNERKIRQSAEVELNGTYKKPIGDDEYNEIQVSKKEYLDHLLDKISRNGVNSLSQAEMTFLDKFGKDN